MVGLGLEAGEDRELGAGVEGGASSEDDEGVDEFVE